MRDSNREIENSSKRFWVEASVLALVGMKRDEEIK